MSPSSADAARHRDRHPWRLVQVRALPAAGGAAWCPYFVPTMQRRAWNPYLAAFLMAAGLGDDGFRDPLPRRLADLRERRNCERCVLADHRRCQDLTSVTDP